MWILVNGAEKRRKNTCSSDGRAYKFEKSIVSGIGGGGSTDANRCGWIVCDWDCGVSFRSCCSWWCRCRCWRCSGTLVSSVADSYFFGYFLLAVDSPRSDQSWWNRGTLARFSSRRCNPLWTAMPCAWSIDIRFSAYVPSMTGMPLSRGDTDLDVLKWEINSNANEMKMAVVVCVCLWIHFISFKCSGDAERPIQIQNRWTMTVISGRADVFYYAFTHRLTVSFRSVCSVSVASNSSSDRGSPGGKFPSSGST